MINKYKNIAYIFIIMDNLIEELLKYNCIKVGNFLLKSGSSSKYYFDMKNLISYPKLLSRIGDLIYNMLNDFDVITGIPYGGLPIATYISTKYNKPMIILRNETKNYGTEKLIEGEYSKTDRCVIIDDVITSGGSLIKAYNSLVNHINVVDIVTIFDRQQHNNPISFRSLLSKTDVIQYRLKQITKEKNSRLCFSADIENVTELTTTLDKIGEYIVICKIHTDIYSDKTLFKKIIIDASIKHNFLIMEDRKFNDISHIVSKQYAYYNNWVDIVTVHALVSEETLRLLSSAMIVANMSNNDYDFSDKALELANRNPRNVLGFITQHRIDKYFVHMTPGIGFTNTTEKDQKYKTVDEVDTDYFIMGRSIIKNIDNNIYDFLVNNKIISKCNNNVD